MINLILGAPGGGKSYEANVFHILEALKRGRKVITNLPVNVEAYAAIDPGFRDLLEVRRVPSPIRGTWDPSREDSAYHLYPEGREIPAPKGARVFGGVWDYFDTWRHDKTGQGALFVIDECHLAMPKGQTHQHVEEWYSLHRHFNADVVLITQSYGKISQAVRDLVQVVYRVRKNVALGSTKSYTRKVQDGLRGEVVNTSIRQYKSQYFGLYRSHTQGEAASEANASDVRPIWKHWSFIGAAFCAVLLIGILATGKVKAPWMVQASPATTMTGNTLPVVKAHHAPASASSVVTASSAPASAPVSDPFAGRGLHLVGYMKGRAREIWTFVISQNGQGLITITDAELQAAGYTWQGHSHCSGVLTYQGGVRNVICDAPQVGVFSSTATPQPKASAPGTV